MKKRVSILLLLITFICPSLMNASDSSYRPMLKQGKSWNLYYSNLNYECNLKYSIEGDTIVDGEYCFKMSSVMTDLNTGAVISTSTNGLFLEKDKKVYQIKKGTWELVYDFNMKKGDVRTIGESFRQEVINTDEVNVKGDTYRRITLMNTLIDKHDTISNIVYWVEGIGGSKGMMSPDYMTSFGNNYMESCYEDGKCIFTGWNYGEIPLYYKSLIEDGKVWKMEYEVMFFPPDHENTFYYDYLVLRDFMTVDDIWFMKVYARSEASEGKDTQDWKGENYWIGEKNGRIYHYYELDNYYTPMIDFSLSVGDSLVITVYFPEDEEPICECETYRVIAVSDTIIDSSTEKRSRHCIYVEGKYSKEKDCWVEGIGSLKYGINVCRRITTTGSFQKLILCSQNGKVLYRNKETNGIVPTIVPKSELRIVPSLFDLQGRRIQGQPTHGIYIKDGKKVMVK